MSNLSESERKMIEKRIQSLAQPHMSYGIFTGSRSICHNCGYAKPVIGAVQYGNYRLCNDCALQYELYRAEGSVKNIEDFVLDD